MKLVLPLFFLLYSLGFTYGQTNMLITNSTANNYLHGNYNPEEITAGTAVLPNEFASLINQQVNPDSLKANIIQLATFKNRNTGSDTISNSTGIGAARRWVHSKFEQYASINPRLAPAYFQFEQEICEQTLHRNIIAVLPGTDTTDKSIIVVEGHIDSRCQDVCDTACVAEGVEDNATGTALVMELARVFSQYKLKRTILFAVVIGEEQGLFGANAISQYCLDENIPVRAVYNNDVIGGIICGKTASSPGCPGENEIDSTQVRLFSNGSNNSINKGLARYAKLQYQEDLLPIVSVPMELSIMSAEDRGGRGGDHQPFRADGFAAIRFCSAHEHGDASNGPDYTDRQHTERDGLGIDTDGDMVVDSFFVDFNYLARNAVINGTAASVAANSLLAPGIEVEQTDTNFIITLTPTEPGVEYKIFYRLRKNDFDTIITTTELVNYIPKEEDEFFMHFSAATVDEYGIESLFSDEVRERVRTGIDDLEPENTGIQLLANKPNPFDEATTLFFEAEPRWSGKKGTILITDINGKQIKQMPIVLETGLNEILYRHGFNQVGTYYYSLVVDGQVLGTNAMVFAN